MINLKKILLKLLEREQKIGQSSESLIAKIYEVGDVYITSTNTNPSAWLGGTWQLIDKKFKEASYSASGGTALSGVTWGAFSDGTANSIYCMVVGHTLHFYSTFKNAYAPSDTTRTIMTIDTTKFGLSAGILVGIEGMWADGLNAMGMIMTGVYDASSTITIQLEDFVNVTGSYTTSTGQYCGLTFDIVPSNISQMIDSFCDRFYWQRTA